MANELETRRSGSYRHQSTGYSAFYPAPLPPNPDLQIDLEMQTLLSKADRALGRLDGSIQTLPNPDLFVFMYVRKEAVLSSQIEGTQSSLNDILGVEAQVLDPKRPSDVNEVLNYVRAMNHGLVRLPDLPISIRLIREIHGKLMSGVRGQEMEPGEIRRTQNWIGPAGCGLRDALFVPPPPEEVMNALGALETFIYDETSIPPLIKVGLAHCQFETIHPFLDGNGRVGRLLIAFMLCEREILQHPVLYLSHYLKKNRPRYYDLLQAVRDHGDWESWIKFFLRGVAEVSLEATETARRIVGLRESHRSIVTAEFGRTAGNGLLILESLFQMPIINVQDAATRLGITYQAANGLVQRMVDAGILFEMTGQSRYRVFEYRPYIGLFASVIQEDIPKPAA